MNLNRLLTEDDFVEPGSLAHKDEFLRNRHEIREEITKKREQLDKLEREIDSAEAVEQINHNLSWMRYHRDVEQRKAKRRGE